MTENIKTHPLKQLFTGFSCGKMTCSALISFGLLTQPLNAAEQEWWFDVEVILFERNLQVADISEKFEQSRLAQQDNEYIDILTPYLYPDLSYLRAGLNYCRASNKQAVKERYEQGFSLPNRVVEEDAFPSSANDEQTLGENLAAVSSSDNAEVEVSEVEEVERFQYKVATTDIFSQSDEQSTLAETAENQQTADINSGAVSTAATLGQQEDLKQPSLSYVKAPIEVEFIDWKIPSELPCAYAEEIDPSFASIDYLKAELSNQANNILPRVPVEIDGIEWSQKRSAILLPQSTMRLNDLYEKIKKQRDISPILHINWRQQVYFGRENGHTIRLFAGQNYAQQFDAQGLSLPSDTDTLIDSLSEQADEFYIPEQELALLSEEQHQALLDKFNGAETIVEEDIFARIDKALNDDASIDFEHANEITRQQTNSSDSSLLQELWQLDGGIKVYLRRVGRVPYLHIDSNLDYRQPIYQPKLAAKTAQLPIDGSLQPAIGENLSKQPNYLQSVNFNQLRRVISKQVHYFDHPLFGMVVLINRYRWPEIEPEADPNASDL